MSRHPARMEAVRLLVDELIAHSLMRDEDAGAMYFDRAVLNWKKSFSYEWVARDMTEEQLADVRGSLMLRPGVDLELLRRELDRRSRWSTRRRRPRNGSRKRRRRRAKRLARPWTRAPPMRRAKTMATKDSVRARRSRLITERRRS